MGCTKHFLNFTWEHHAWRPRVKGYEIVTGEETNMWARVMYRDYVRCDKEYVCERCGKVRQEVSCLCDTYHGERCKILQDYIAQSGETMK